MRALRCHETGEPAIMVVDDVPDPMPAGGEVLVEVEVAAINFVDTLMVAGRYQIPFDPPFVPGSDFAGTIKTLGPGATRFAVGDRVHGMSMLGAYAELVAVPEASLRPTPEGLSADQACALGSGMRTAYDALVSIAQIQPGENLVVLGAGGSVGTAAISIAKALGARVIACSSSEKLPLCEEAGADDVVDYNTVDLKAELKRLAGEGVDVVLDLVGGPVSEAALRATGFGGRFVVVGFASGSIPRIPLNLVLLKGSTILGYEIVGFERHRAAEAESNRIALEQMILDGRVQPSIQNRFALEEGPAAMQTVAGRAKQGATLLQVKAPK